MKFLLILLVVLIAGYFHVSQKQQIESLQGELTAANEKTAELQQTIVNLQQTIDKLRAAPSPTPSPLASPSLASKPTPPPVVAAPTPDKSWMWKKSTLDTPQLQMKGKGK